MYVGQTRHRMLLFVRTLLFVSPLLRLLLLLSPMDVYEMLVAALRTLRPQDVTSMRECAEDASKCPLTIGKEMWPLPQRLKERQEERGKVLLMLHLADLLLFV